MALELHAGVTNVGQSLTPPSIGRLAPFVIDLGRTADLVACGTICESFKNASATNPHLTRCRSFTRFTATGRCFGHLDPIWIPLNGINKTSGLSLADSGLVVRVCESEFDCSHNGRCVAGACTCSQGWSGRRCETLALLPVDKTKLGFSPTDSTGQNQSSWGGSILSFGGTWHGWFAKMVHSCGIGQWEQNSKIVHATAKDVLGPYIESESVVEVFAHEPCVTRDPRTGELLMVSVNFPVDGPFANRSIFNASGICTCTPECTQRAVGPRRKCDANCSSPPSPHPFLPILRTASRPDGPWTSSLSPVMDHSDSNLACWINATGAVTCSCRGGGTCASAAEWKNFASWRRRPPGWVSSRPNDEDPMLWQDMETGVWHAITHNLMGPHMVYGQLAQVGLHEFSLDGEHWYVSGTAYTNNVTFTDGTSYLFDRRERPHLVFEENTTKPVALSNSVRPGGQGSGDRTFTLVQGLRIGCSRLQHV